MFLEPKCISKIVIVIIWNENKDINKCVQIRTKDIFFISHSTGIKYKPLNVLESWAGAAFVLSCFFSLTEKLFKLQVWLEDSSSPCFVIITLGSQGLLTEKKFHNEAVQSDLYLI